MEQTKIFLIIGMTAVFAMLLVPALNAAPANAINEDKWQIEQKCTNRGGGEPIGQQPDCKGGSHGGLTAEKEVRNPAGNYVPGQNR